MANFEIYETYMHFDHTAGTGKKTQVLLMEKIMESLLFLATVMLFLIYFAFSYWYLYIVNQNEPENKKHHTKLELEVNWAPGNRAPILNSFPLLTFFVENYLLFYWLGSIFGIILVYLKTSSWLVSILAAVLFILGMVVSLKLVQAIVIIRVKKYWH